MSTDFQTTVITAAGVRPESAAMDAILERREIFEKTAVAEEAVLRPRQPGLLTHELRAALAARIATANGEAAEAARYAAAITTPAMQALASPGSTATDGWTQAIVTFTDAVATNPRDIAAADIEALKAAGVTDADIVRAAELNAFLAYQLRLIAGLRLLRGTAK